jgi:LPPG:FO 2-phospho-L-lactate transferase
VVHFQEWWVRMHAATPAARIVASGAERARPAPGVLDAIEAADVVLFPPSNPVVSIGTILAVPGIRAAVAAKAVVGVSPIIGGSAVGAHYGPELIDGWLVDDQDKAADDDPALAGIEVRALPLLMRDLPATTAIARAALDLALELT